jgi:alkanesulfonate monooxygenase SsuD/methylene tetrahydromethanopterin reductase-like flavin-dependent oxidoreductase (luciferase family)
MREQSLPRSIVFSTDLLEPLINLSLRAEAAGFHRVWTTEYPHRDAIVRALAIALRTERIRVATGISYAFSRSSLALASMAADVQRLAGGRFALGLGPGTRGVRRWYDADFDPPAAKLLGCADAVRQAWRRNPHLADPPPLYASALGATIGRRVASTFDGVLLHPLALSPTHLHERLLPAIRQGAGDRKTPHIVAWCITSVDAEEERARHRARSQLAFYFSTPSYATVAEGTSWEDVPARVREAFRIDPSRKWGDLARLIPDKMLDDLTLSGTRADVAAKSAALAQDLSQAGVAEIAFAAAGADVGLDEFRHSCGQVIEALGQSAPTQG